VGISTQNRWIQDMIWPWAEARGMSARGM